MTVGSTLGLMSRIHTRKNSLVREFLELSHRRNIVKNRPSDDEKRQNFTRSKSLAFEPQEKTLDKNLDMNKKFVPKLNAFEQNRSEERRVGKEC